MKTELVTFLLALLALVTCGALEEILPKVLGVGFPCLLVATQFFAVRRGALAGVLFAVAAGALEDALSALPLLCSVSYFVPVALIVSRTDTPRLATLLSWPLYHFWLVLWLVNVRGLFGRILVALPFGAVTAFAVVLVLDWSFRKAGCDEQD